MSNTTVDLRAVSLGDKYDLSIDDVYLTGTQALVRMCLLQSQMDRNAGLKTAGYVTGYRGSPLGGLDQQFGAANGVLGAADVLFQPGLNEDLAATAIWGTQQATIRGEGVNDGVFGLWYGKGPGVDRSGDAFRHGNLAGSAEFGGVLALMGDDHTSESSTTCHQSEFALVDAMMPVLNPSNIQEIVEYGLHGWAMSRMSGLWVGLKCVKDNVESSGSVNLPLNRPVAQVPEFDAPQGGLNIRARDDRHEQERRLHGYKLDAARAYARANNLDRVVYDGGKAPKIGIVSTGKSWMDVATALDDLGLDGAQCAKRGVATYKVGMVWPLEPAGLVDFAADLDLVIVVEEKRGLIEGQMREILYGGKNVPVIIGKRDEEGARLFHEEGALNPHMIASVIAARLPDMDSHVARLANAIVKIDDLGVARTPYFCAGCPHNSSTTLPEGARGYAGIGCHWMVQAMDRATEGYTQMGGEGANWIGEAPFSTRDHVFQNLGDGTYNHSGLLAIRASIAAGVNVTYKILYNDAVAMTGGQRHEGGLPPEQVLAEVIGAGAQKVAVVADNTDDVDLTAFPTGTVIHGREKLNAVQTDLGAVKGVSVLLYIQTCATEKRRRRKRGLMTDPAKRVLINADICEACGDCGVQSNCVAIAPIDTDLGTKRQIDQSACNKDFSCVKGFCPSFVTVEGGTLRKPAHHDAGADLLPEPDMKLTLDRPKSILLTGVGGTGVVTIGALLGMAAHLEGKGAGLIDMAGLAQKGGAVTTHIRLAATPDAIKAIRIAPQGGDLMLGCDALTSAGRETLALLRSDAHIVANTHEMMTGAFVRDRDFALPSSDITKRLMAATPDGQTHLCDATAIARKVMGDTIGANLFMLGVAYQNGLIPLSRDAIQVAIRMNGVAVDFNLSAFHWGRVWVADRAKLDAIMVEPTAKATSVSDITADRRDRLVAYQNADLATRYARFVDGIAAKDNDPMQRVTGAVARNLFKLMAYKDEYEVARLMVGDGFQQQLAAQFEGDFKLSYHLAPPFLSGVDGATGRAKKRQFGAWIIPLMKVLMRMKGLRGTWADPFGKTHERRLERALIADYMTDMEHAMDGLNDGNYETILSLAMVPSSIRGFGAVKHESITKAAIETARLKAKLAA